MKKSKQKNRGVLGFYSILLFTLLLLFNPGTNANNLKYFSTLKLVLFLFVIIAALAQLILPLYNRGVVDLNVNKWIIFAYFMLMFLYFYHAFHVVRILVLVVVN